MNDKELLEKWFGKKFKWLGETRECLGVNDEWLIYWNQEDVAYGHVLASDVKEEKEPQIIYVYWDKNGRPLANNTEIEFCDGRSKMIKFKEVIE
tara:strand:- start:854 stop:1135 length:282 start_codon:yes stop_codon:yes gene_type:complete